MTFQKTKKSINKIGVILIIFITISLTGTNFLFGSKPSLAQNIEEINRQIEERKQEIDSLEEKIKTYQENIKQKQTEAISLRNQLYILENQIIKLELDIQATEKRTQQTNLEIQKLNLQIKETEEKIESQKGKIADFIRLIYSNDQVSYLEILLLHDSFSEFFDQIKYLQEIHSDLKKSLEKLKSFKAELNLRKDNLEEKKKQEEELKDQLTKDKAKLEAQKTARGILLAQTRLTEKQYQKELYQLQLEQQQINAEIITLEKKVREELEKKKWEERFKAISDQGFIWPVDPGRGITAYFHDPEYPYRYIFEHPGIDIRTPQGTAIRAAASGYVARVKFKGDSSYAYIMLIHPEGFSTVYGHVSAVRVSEDEFVSQGQIIGLSGGTPRTTGAGQLTTGPHLHFEIRLNGIPINPLEYLP